MRERTGGKSGQERVAANAIRSACQTCAAPTSPLASTFTPPAELSAGHHPGTKVSTKAKALQGGSCECDDRCRFLHGPDDDGSRFERKPRKRSSGGGSGGEGGGGKGGEGGEGKPRVPRAPHAPSHQRG